MPFSGPIRYTLGPVKVFPAGNGEDADVLYVEVESPDLHSLHSLLGTLPHKNTHSSYKPHVTLGRVKAGTGHRIAAGMPRLHLSGEASELLFVSPSGTLTCIPLVADVSAKAGVIASLLASILTAMNAHAVSHPSKDAVKSWLETHGRETHAKAFDKLGRYHGWRGHFVSLKKESGKPVGHPQHIKASGEAIAALARSVSANAESIAGRFVKQCEAYNLSPAKTLADADECAGALLLHGAWVAHAGESGTSAHMVAAHLLSYAFDRVKRAVVGRVSKAMGAGMSSSVGSIGGFLCDPPKQGKLLRLKRGKRKRRRFLKAEVPTGDHGAPELLLALLHAHSQQDKSTIRQLESLLDDPVKLAATVASLKHGGIVQKAEPSASRHEGEVWHGGGNRWFTLKQGRVVPAKNPNAQAAGQGDNSQPPTQQTQQQAAPKKAADPGIQAAADAANIALTEPHNLTLDHVKTLAAHLNKLTVSQLKQMANGLAVKLGGDKANLVANLLLHVKSLAVKNAPRIAAESVHQHVATAQADVEAARVVLREIDEGDEDLRSKAYKLNNLKNKTPESQAQAAELGRQIDEIGHKRWVQWKEVSRLKAVAVSKFADSLAEHIKTPATLTASLGHSFQPDAAPIAALHPDQQKSIDAAHAFLGKVCNWSGDVSYTLVQSKAGRAWADGKSIAVGHGWDTIIPPADAGSEVKSGWDQEWAARSVAKTHVHEIGHLIEFRKPGVKEKARAFLARRRGDEEPTKLTVALRGDGYGPEEKGIKDSFDKAFGKQGWYVGKIYNDGDTEIVSMGLEKLYDSPAEFAVADPEYFKFMIEVLTS